MQSTISSKIQSAKDAVESAISSMKSSISSVLNALSDAWNKVKEFGSKVWNSTIGSLSGKAEGGQVSSGTMYLVGEEGPELFVPRTDGYIINNEDMMDYFGSENQGEINIYIQGDVYDDQYSMKRKLKSAMLEVLREQVAYG